MRRAAGAIVAGCLALGLMASPAGAKTSRSCRDALTDSEAVIQINAQFADAVNQMFTDQQEFARQGSDGEITTSDFIDGLTSTITTLSGKVQSLTVQVGNAVQDYRREAKLCRAGK